MRVVDLIGPNASWKSRAILPSSIPHLLHNDLCLLWVLRRTPALRPDEWTATVELWRRLLSLLLLGRLRPQREPATPPFTQFCDPHRLTSITRYFLGDVPVAVSSPATIIRPLPGCNPAELMKTLPDPAAEDLSDVLAGFAQLLQRRLKSAGVADPAEEESADATPPRHPAILAEIVQSDVVRALGLTGVERTHVKSRPFVANVWARTDDTLWQDAQFTAIEFEVFDGVDLERFVPRCGKCNQSLLMKQTDRVEVLADSETVAVPCTRAGCNRENQLPLDSLMICNVGREPIAWTDREPYFSSSQCPPSPMLSNVEALFEWNRMAAGDRDRRFLTLVFRDRPVKAAPLSTLFFDRLIALAPGPQVTCLPIRPEWVGLLRDRDGVVEERTPADVRFKRLRIAGTPAAIEKRYLRTDIELHENASAAVYPARLPDWWLRYRVSVGGGASTLLVRLEGVAASPRTTCESVAGWPANVWVQTADGKAGCGFVLDKVKGLASSPGAIDHRVAVDFGTSSTVASYAFGAGMDERFVEPGRLRESVCVIAGAPAARLPFLPGADAVYGDDQALFPTALWHTGGGADGFIRFDDHRPSAEHRASHGFKWEGRETSGNASPLRRAYLEELLFLVLPSALHQARSSQKPNVRLGFAFPLAFGSTLRDRFAGDLDHARQAVLTWLRDGLATQVAVNESTAAVTAFGGHNPKDTYLLADLGGGSLDLSIFTKRPADDGFEYLQLGSYHFGGELFLEQIVRQLSPNADQRESHYWRTRNAIVQGRAADELAGHLKTLHTASETFLPLALEIVRVSADAFRQSQPETRLNVLLIGNGWRAAQFAPDRVRSLTEAAQSLEERTERFENPQLALLNDVRIPPKRYVSRGTMRWLEQGLPDQLRSTSRDQTRLPAGVGFTLTNTATKQFVEIHWDQILGAGGERVNPGGYRYTELDIQFRVDDVSPMPARWAPALSNALRACGLGDQPYPKPSEWLRHLQAGFDGERLLVGPFQITVQEHWRRSLEGR